MLRALIPLAVALAAFGIGTAEARPFLSKQRAHAKTAAVMADFGPMYEPDGTPTVRIVPARKCERASRISVYCGVRVKTRRDTCYLRLRLELRSGRVTWHYPSFIFDSPCYVEPSSPIVVDR